MKEDLVKIVARLYTLKDDIEDSNNRQRMELEETIDELERMILDIPKHKDMPDDEDAMGMYPWHNKPHEEEG